MILDGVGRATLETLAHGCPLAADGVVQVNDEIIFFSREGRVQDGWVDVIVPAFAALLATAADCMLLCDLVPLLVSVCIDET